MAVLYECLGSLVYAFADRVYEFLGVVLMPAVAIVSQPRLRVAGTGMEYTQIADIFE